MSEQAANDKNTGGEGIPRRVALSEKDKLRMKRKAKIKRMEKYKSKRVYEFLISMDYSEKQRFFFHLCYPLMRKQESNLYLDGLRK